MVFIFALSLRRGASFRNEPVKCVLTWVVDLALLTYLSVYGLLVLAQVDLGAYFQSAGEINFESLPDEVGKALLGVVMLIFAFYIVADRVCAGSKSEAHDLQSVIWRPKGNLK